MTELAHQSADAITSVAAAYKRQQEFLGSLSLDVMRLETQVMCGQALSFDQAQLTIGLDLSASLLARSMLASNQAVKEPYHQMVAVGMQKQLENRAKLNHRVIAGSTKSLPAQSITPEMRILDEARSTADLLIDLQWRGYSFPVDGSLGNNAQLYIAQLLSINHALQTPVEIR